METKEHKSGEYESPRDSGIITEYAEKHGIACYNRNILAGGEGAAKKMQEASLLGRDGVHYTQNGYVLWGRLTAMALIETLSAKNMTDRKKFHKNLCKNRCIVINFAKEKAPVAVTE